MTQLAPMPDTPLALATNSANPSSNIPQSTNPNTGTMPVAEAPSAAASAPGGSN